MNASTTANAIFFGVLPYVALALFVIVSIQRYRTRKFSVSSLSSQFLENRQHFWGMVPFHYGILFVLAGHIAACLIPAQILQWNAEPIRLLILEIAALVGGLLALAGLAILIVRRLADARARMVTSPIDWLVLLLLTFQVFTGVYMAVFHPWGSSWFASNAAPYLMSIVLLSPNTVLVDAMPSMVKLHIVNAWILIALFPFTRLIHILVIPIPYFWRRTQVVRWHWDRQSIRRAD